MMAIQYKEHSNSELLLLESATGGLTGIARSLIFVGYLSDTNFAEPGKLSRACDTSLSACEIGHKYATELAGCSTNLLSCPARQ